MTVAGSRVDGPDKVTGRARYAFEYPVSGAAYVWPVQSVIARGEIRSVDPAAALALPSVLAVLTHQNAPRLNANGSDPELLLFQSAGVAYRGQIVAGVVATTLETAREAAGLVRIEYAEAAHDVTLTPDHPRLYAPERVNPNFPGSTAVGDFDAAFAAAPVTVDQTYSTPGEHNNPMEPHATIASWDDGRLTVFDSNQGPSVHAAMIAGVLGLQPGQVRVITEHVGGGFGCKGFPRPNVILAAMAARATGRPVKCALTRQQMFAVVGHRPPSIQRVRLGATADGSLTAIAHDVISQSSTLKEFAEQTAVATRHMYAAPHRRTRTGWPGSTCRRRPGCGHPASARACSRWSRPWTSWRLPAPSTRWSCGSATTRPRSRSPACRSPPAIWLPACVRAPPGSGGGAATRNRAGAGMGSG